MADQNKLLDILYRMQSDYIPEHTAAAHDFMNEGFPTDLLLSLIKKTHQPNLVSMFFYISGQRSDSETLKAWDYLRRRFELEPQKFDSSNNCNPTCNPNDLEDSYRYLLFAARKHLVIEDKLSVFLSHLKSIQLEAASVVKQALSKLDVNSNDNASLYDDEHFIFIVRSEVQQVIPTFEVEPTKRNFSPEELNIVSFVSTLDKECCKILNCDRIPILLYRQWLVEFFLKESTIKPQLKLILSSLENKENLIPFVGYNFYNLNWLYDEVNGTHEFMPKHRNISIPDVKNAFQKMKNMVCNFSFEEYVTRAEKKSKYKKGQFMHYDRCYFPDVPCPYDDAIQELKEIERDAKIGYGFTIWSVSNVLYYRKNVDFCLDILNHAENIAILWLENDMHNYESAVIAANFYFYFYQTKYDFGYTIDFCNGVFYALQKSTEFYEALLVPYLDEVAFSDIRSRREAQGYMALDVLLPAKSLTAYHFVRGMLKSGKAIDLEPPYKNYWESRLNLFFKAIGGDVYLREAAFAIGFEWERLCQKIHRKYYQNVNINDGSTTLENRAEPDITVGVPQRNSRGKVIHVERIIECKKSLYFVGTFDYLNNKTTDKYIPYCDILEYWILEKLETFKESNFTKVRYVFADDLLNASWLSNDLKVEVKNLLSKSLTLDRMRQHKLQTIEELFFAIDYILNAPPLPIKEKRQNNKSKPATVIRQYTLDGTFIKEFKSPHDAAEATGIKSDAITTVTSGRRNSAGGFLWKKCEADSPQENIDPPNTSLDLKGKVILQIDQTGEVVSTYNTLVQAVKLSGINRRSISDALKGIQKTAGGYSWILSDSIDD